MNNIIKNSIVSTIGSVGIDKIKLCNLFGNDDLQIEDMTRAAQETDLIVKANTHTKTAVTGDDFVFSFGFSGGRTFCWLEISASKHKNPNLLNVSPEDIRTRMIEIQADLLEKKIIPCNFHMDEIRVYSMEVNRTVPLEANFHDYERILRLLADAVHPDDPNTCIMPVSRAKKMESIYVCQKNSKMTIKIYDKGKHLSEHFKCSTDCDFLRCEITAMEQILATSRMSDDSLKKNKRCFYFKDLSSDNLNEFYTSEIGLIFENFDKEMKKKADLTMNMSDTMKLALQNIVDTALRISNEEACKNLLLMFAQHNTFLDYKDILETLDFLSIDESLKCRLRNGFQYILEVGDITGSRDKLLHQREKYIELREKLLKEHNYTVLMFDRYAFLVGNPNHIKVSTMPGTTFGLDHNTTVFIAYPVGMPWHAYAYYFDGSENRYKVRLLSESEHQKYIAA